jgi:gas vesicle structural protein
VSDVVAAEDVALIDLLDRLLNGGVVITGDITLAVADVDLVYVALQLVVASVPTLEGRAG